MLNRFTEFGTTILLALDLVQCRVSSMMYSTNNTGFPESSKKPYWKTSIVNTHNTGKPVLSIHNTGKPVLSIDTQYWIPVLFYSTILENTGQYWDILNFQYCKITSIAQYCTQKNTGFPVLSNLGIGLRQHTILVFQYCTNNTGTEKCSSICNNTGIPVS